MSPVAFSQNIVYFSHVNDNLLTNSRDAQASLMTPTDAPAAMTPRRPLSSAIRSNELNGNDAIRCFQLTYGALSAA